MTAQGLLMSNFRVSQKETKERKAESTVYISECVGVLCCALGFISWVTQGKDDWSFIQGSHGLDDIVGEQTSSSCHTWKKEREILVTLCL